MMPEGTSLGFVGGPLFFGLKLKARFSFQLGASFDLEIIICSQ